MTSSLLESRAQLHSFCELRTDQCWRRGGNTPTPQALPGGEICAGGWGVDRKFSGLGEILRRLSQAALVGTRGKGSWIYEMGHHLPERGAGRKGSAVAHSSQGDPEPLQGFRLPV